ncbi:MAG: sigma 54-interacting transcriptional regulator [Planctomycetota bacterium]
MVAAAEPFLGVSDSIRTLISQVPRLAKSKAPLLIEGESGTGKSRLARLIHERSDRLRGAFQVMDCGAVPSSIFARELFGHVEGAFTGAERSRPGRIQAADGGTFLLQGVDRLDASGQATLLRVLDDGEVFPVGAIAPDRVDVRFLQTSQVSLGALVKSNAFRGDLFYKLSGITVTIPPLRERREDLRFFLDHFLQIESRALRRNRPVLSPELRRRLLSYDWPGNVGELRHTLRGLLTMIPDDAIKLDQVPAELRLRLKTRAEPIARTFSIPVGLSFQRQVETFQRALLLRVAREVGGKRDALLRELDLAPHQLKYLSKKLGLPNSAEGEPGAALPESTGV